MIYQLIGLVLILAAWAIFASRYEIAVRGAIWLARRRRRKLRVERLRCRAVNRAVSFGGPWGGGAR